jgi:ABC-2 type transport system ATP-binding protein
MTREPNNAKEHLGVVPEVSNIYDEMSPCDNLIFAAQLYRVPKDEREKRARALNERHDR